ncbi:MAG: hypothetical protein U1E51_25185, partial [Candidatus Binatia bacterium]|nr:hypothetical protein [Candidatus Binatia bacterium]
MRIIGVDPGPARSAYVVLMDGNIIEKGTLPNEALPSVFKRDTLFGTLAVEMIASYGMPVGKEVFETCVWIGRFVELWGGHFKFIYRRDVKLHLCNS